MLHMIGHAFLGLLVGLCARFLMPGMASFGLVMTAILGIAGGFVGGWIGRMFGWYKEGHPAGFVMSVVGAVALLYAYHFVA